MPLNRRDFLKAAGLSATQARAAAFPHALKTYPDGITAEEFGEYRPDRPEEARLLHMAHFTLATAQDMLSLHGQDCPCCLCVDARGLAYNVEQGMILLACNLNAQPGQVANCPCCEWPRNNVTAS